MKNVVIICLDSVRKDFFEVYSSEIQNAANLSFDQCRAASSWSVPSHGSMLTGSLPSKHGAHAHSMSYSHLSKNDTFLDRIPDYETIGVSANAFAGPGYDFDVFFDSFHPISDSQRWPPTTNSGDDSPSNPLPKSVKHVIKSVGNITAGKLNEASTEWSVPKLFDDGAKVVTRQSLSQVKEATEPFFLFVNYMDAHLPLRPTRGYNSDLYSVSGNWSTADYDQWEMINDPSDEYLIKSRALYGASIEYLDREVSKLISGILDIAPDTSIVVTADHGDNLGYSHEEKLLRHRSSLSEGLLHVPLSIVNAPPDWEPPQEGYFSQLNLGDLVVNLAEEETLCNLFRDEIAAEIAGLAQCPDPPKDTEYWKRAIRCVYRNKKKYVWDSLGEHSAYEIIPGRPCWQRILTDAFEVAEIESEWFDSSIEEFKHSALSEQTDHDVDESTKSRLKKLGYM